MEKELKRRCEELYIAEVKDCVKFTSIKSDYIYEPISNCLYIFIVLSDVGWVTFVRYKFCPENT